jgi:AcrR family transcriptional regulator
VSDRGRGPIEDRPALPIAALQVAEMQRARLLSGAVAAVDELGYTDTTVAHITSRARISRRTFYDLFENREDCLLAVLEDAVALLTGELAAAKLDGLVWRERIRVGLWRILCFFDREPALARVCVVQSARGSQRVLEYREDIFARLAGAIAQGSGEGVRARECPPLVAEGLVGAAASILYTRLLKGQHEALGGLLGELMGMIVLPYMGPAAASRERARPAPALAPLVSAGIPGGAHLALDLDPLRDIPMRLTYRTALVLEGIAERPGVSNRELAEHVGISDQGQISKLLTRLERLGLVSNTGRGQAEGASNAWELTPTGARVTQSISTNVRHPREAA